MLVLCPRCNESREMMRPPPNPKVVCKSCGQYGRARAKVRHFRLCPDCGDCKETTKANSGYRRCRGCNDIAKRIETAAKQAILPPELKRTLGIYHPDGYQGVPKKEKVINREVAIKKKAARPKKETAIKLRIIRDKKANAKYREDIEADAIHVKPDIPKQKISDEDMINAFYKKGNINEDTSINLGFDSRWITSSAARAS